MSEEKNKFYIKDENGEDIYMGEIATKVWNAAIEAAIKKFRYEFVAPAVIIKMLKELKK
jgi:hypothetical protein